MRSLRNGAVLLAILGAAGWVTYTYLLSDEAKSGIHKAAQEVKSAYEHVSDIIRDAQGSYVKEDLPNRRRTAEQWESLGF